MKRAVLFLVVPLAVLVASLWAYQALSPTGLPRQQMTRAERAEADKKAITIAAKRKEQQRRDQEAADEAAFDKLLTG